MDVVFINFSVICVLQYLFSSAENYVATLTLGGAGAHATYYHKANDQVSNINPKCVIV